MGTMTHDEIEHVLGRIVRQLGQRALLAHQPKMKEAVITLQGHFIDVRRLFILAGSAHAARSFAQRLGKQFVLVDSVEKLRGLELSDFIILEPTLQSFSMMGIRAEILDYIEVRQLPARPTEVWHIYDW